MANYMDNNNATEVFGAYASKINKIEPISITWANYQLLSEVDKNSHRYIITDYPAQGAGQQLGTAAFKNTGVANGVADLDANGKVPSSQLPSYVDDTVEGYLYNGVFYSDSEHEHPITGETGKIYVELVSNKTYRWSGSAYVEISESLALGETSSTAYAGNKGKANADNIFVIQKLIPSGASSSNKLATASDIPTITGKADKVSGATNGNLAGLDANGNLTDSGIASAIFPSGASSSDKLVKASENNFKYTNLNGDYNFNTLITTGVYSVHVSDITAQNSPPRTGWLQVYVSLAANNSNYVQQLAVFQEGDIFIRVMNNGAWYGWDRLVKHTIIATDTDLNTLNTSGVYGIYINSNKVGDCHAPNYWFMTIYVGAGGLGVINQTVITMVDNSMYTRSSGDNGNTWTEWNIRSTVRIGNGDNITNDGQWHTIQLNMSWTAVRALNIVAKIDWAASLTSVIIPTNIFDGLSNAMVSRYDDGNGNYQALSVKPVSNNTTQIQISIEQGGIMDSHANAVYVFGMP